MIKKSASLLVPKTVSLFQCPACQKTSKTKTVIDKCLAQHVKDEAHDEEISRVASEVAVYQNFIVNNLKTVRRDDVRGLLVEAARQIGFELSFYLFETSYNSEDKLSFRTDGCFRRVAKAPKCLDNYRLSHTNFNGRDPWIGDLCDFLTGVSSGGGSGGSGGRFNYQIYIKLSEIPELFAKVTERKELKEKSKVFNREVDRLKAIHLREWETILAQSDVITAVLKSDLDEQSKQLMELTALHNQTSRAFDARKKIIIEDHAKPYIIPGPQFDFDLESFNKLGEYDV